MLICDYNSYYVTKLTPWNRVLLQKVTIAYLVKKFPLFIKPSSQGHFSYLQHSSPCIIFL